VERARGDVAGSSTLTTSNSLRAALALFFATLVTVPGCSRTAWTLPFGVVTNPGDYGKPLVGGIYPSQTPGDQSCCWVARQSRFRVARTGPATDLAITIYLPDVASLHDRPQAVDVTLDGSYRFRKCCYRKGLHTMLFTLPATLRDAAQPIDVAMTMRETFVPADATPGSTDRRQLAAILVSADFRDF
jgi:hypothetical protein